MKQFFVGMTKDQQELRAAAELREQGYVVYLPKIYYRHQDGRKIEARAALRFTGYIFITFDLQLEEHGPISNTRGMDGSDGSALICDGTRKPIALPSGIIERLRQIEDEEFFRAIARKKPKPRLDLVPGDMVSIACDPHHAAHGRKGRFIGSEGGWAEVLEGWAIWKVAECDLRKIQQPERKAA